MLYAQAYIMLDTERDYNEYIPWSAYVAYGQFYNLTRDQIEWLIEIGRVVDKEILAQRAKEHGNASRASRTA